MAMPVDGMFGGVVATIAIAGVVLVPDAGVVTGMVVVVAATTDTPEP